MQANGQSELNIKDCEIIIKAMNGKEYKPELRWVDSIIMHWDMLSMQGVASCMMSFQDHLGFHESIPMKKGITLELLLVDALKNKFKYSFVLTDVTVEDNKTRKRLNTVWMDCYSYKLTSIFDSKGFGKKTTSSFLTFLFLMDDDFGLSDDVNECTPFINQLRTNKDDEYYKFYSYILNGKKSLYRNIKDKCYEEGILCYTDRTARNFVYLKNHFNSYTDVKKEKFTRVAPNNDYFYKIHDLEKLPSQLLDMDDPTAKRDWTSGFTGVPERSDFDFKALEENFKFGKKVSTKINYNDKIKDKETNDISPEGRIVHSYTMKLLQKNKIEILVNGDFSLNLGQLIEIEAFAPGNKLDVKDEELSGIWVITAIQDTIAMPVFSQILTLCRPCIMKNDVSTPKVI